MTDDGAKSDSDHSLQHHSKKHKKHKKSKKQDIKRVKPLEPSKPDTIWISEATPKDGYRVDKRPDYSNLSYDTLYSKDQAMYRRHFSNLCLGLKKGQSIKFTDNRNRKPKKNQSKKQERYHASESLESVHDTALMLTSSDSEIKDKSINESRDVVMLEVGEKDKQVSEDISLTTESYLVHRTSQYNQQLLHEPHNVELWVEFIAFQDEALVWGKLPTVVEGEGMDTKRRRVALLERKIAIYEKALRSNPLSEELIAGHMELVQNFWETERLVTQWKNIVFKQPNSSFLWLKYIEFCQSRFSFFRTSAIIGLYHKCITTLSSILHRTLVSHKPEPDAEKRLMAIVILYCYFLRHCGHLERGVAIFQAMIEFNMCQPGELKEESFNVRREQFKLFWTSGEPRVGEAGSHGWLAFKKRHASKLGVVNSEKYANLFQKREEEKEGEEEEEDMEMTEEEREEAGLVKGLPLNDAWVALEVCRDQRYSLPSRDSEDADSSISFNSVSHCLFSISDTSLHQHLIYEFLRFLGAAVLTPPLLPTVFPGVSQVASAPSDVIGCVSTAHLPFSASYLPSLYYQPLSLGTDYTASYDQKLHTLICQSSVDETIAKKLSDLPPTPPTLKPFIFDLFNQGLLLVSSHSTDVSLSLVYSWLAYEMAAVLELRHRGEGHTPEAQATAQLLQSLAIELLRPTDKHDYGFLWDLTLGLEQCLELKKKPCELSRVLLEPLNEASYGGGLYCLCRCVVECVLGLRRPINCYSRYKQSRDLALYALVAVGDGTFNPTLLPVTPPQLSQTRLLKCASHYHQLSSSVLRDSASPATAPSSLAAFSQLACHAYFEYFVKGLEPACALLDGFISQVAEKTQIRLKLHLLLIQLISNHGKRHPIQPHLQREACLSALQSFPSEGIFLHEYTVSERDSFISGRIRRYFNALRRDGDSFLPWIYAVGAELDRHHRVGQALARGEAIDELSSGPLHRVQSLFRRATGAVCGRMGVALWRLYMKFEVLTHSIRHYYK